MKEFKDGYGCHCELWQGELPDECVIDTGKPNDCCIAIEFTANNKTKFDCPHWMKVEKHEKAR